MKLTTGKTPSTDKKSEKKTPKAKADKKKKNQDDEEEEEKEDAPPVDPVQARKDREREVLFLRHKLQKGFLSRDQEPSEDEMPAMATFFKKLEAYGENLDVQTLRSTKIHKVLKGIIKLSSVPKDDEFHFKERSTKMLAEWNQILGAEPAGDEKADKDDKPSPTTTNGVQKEKVEEKSDVPMEDKPEEVVTASIEAPEQKQEDPEQKAAVPTEAANDAEPAKPAETTTSEEAKTHGEAPAVLDRAPESAAAAAEAVDVVKATE